MLSLRRFHTMCGIKVFRSLSSSPSPEKVVAEPLERRGLLRVSGDDAHGFLQGLMTNDISHVESGPSSIYTMFLNTRGRVLYDALIYQTAEPGVLFIECDASATTALERHLKMYRLRKKVSIDVDNEHEVWAVYDVSLNRSPSAGTLIDNVKDKLLGRVLPCAELELNKRVKRECFSFSSMSSKNKVLMFQDPRIPDLGLRVICSRSENVTKMLNVERGFIYRALRFTLGIGEGVDDLPPDNCFPLEANCDYLHGVSFHKGCYVGQELTARTYHTGVVRKRLMPVILEVAVNEANASKQQILNETDKPVGKVRGVEGMLALGLLRVSEVLSAKRLSLGSTKVQTMRPNWWPTQAPKELKSREKE